MFWSGSGGGVFCCPALAVAAISHSVATEAQMIGRMIVPPQRSNVLPAGLLEPWICAWQLTQLRPIRRLLFEASAFAS